MRVLSYDHNLHVPLGLNGKDWRDDHSAILSTEARAGKGFQTAIWSYIDEREKISSNHHHG